MIPQNQVLTIVLEASAADKNFYVHCGFPPAIVEGFTLKEASLGFVAVKGVTDQNGTGTFKAGMIKIDDNGVKTFVTTNGVKFRDRGFIIGQDPTFKQADGNKLLLKVYPDQEELNLDTGRDNIQAYEPGYALGAGADTGSLPPSGQFGGGGVGPYKPDLSDGFLDADGVHKSNNKWSQVGIYTAKPTD